MASLYVRRIWILAITSAGNAILKSLLKKSFNLLRSNLSLFIPKIIYAIITRTLLTLLWFLAVSNPTLLRAERVKYFSCLVGSMILGTATGLGVAVGGFCDFSK